MNKSFFAAGLIAAAAQAVEVRDAFTGHVAHHPVYNAPRVALRGPYYHQRPYYAEPVVAAEDDHVSTDDDRYSSSDSDSVSSSDEERIEAVPEVCYANGDPFACLRVREATECNGAQTMDARSCTCFEDYRCNILSGGHGSQCPNDRPFQSPVENCACQTYDERRALYNYEWAGRCKYAPAPVEKDLHVAKPLVICSPETDSDSDCVRIGGLRRKITGSYNNKQRDDNGNVDDSIYTDSDCDPRFSSCDTNSNEEFSNTDSNTIDSALEDVPAERIPLKRTRVGSLTEWYAKKYGIVLPEPKHHVEHTYGYGHMAAEESSADDSEDRTSFNIDCDKGDEDCAYKLKCESSGSHEGECRYERTDRLTYEHDEPEVEEEDLPLTGTSNSDDTGSDSFGDSSTASEEEDVIIEDICANVRFTPYNGSDLWGWAELKQIATGAFKGETRIEASFEGLLDAGNHAMMVHEYGDLSWGCLSTGDALTFGDDGLAATVDYPEITSFQDENRQFLTSSARGLGHFTDYNPHVSLQGDNSVFGRSIVVYEKDDATVGTAVGDRDNGKILGCGIIEYGCTPCRNGACDPPRVPVVHKKKRRTHY